MTDFVGQRHTASTLVNNCKQSMDQHVMGRPQPGGLHGNAQPHVDRDWHSTRDLDGGGVFSGNTSGAPHSGGERAGDITAVRLMNARQAAAFLGVPVKWVLEKSAKGELPRLVFSRKVIRFTEADLLAWGRRPEGRQL